ncbi:MAG: M20/M25/M40 family metallo-hydrolase [Actinobacteria bacterium]|nr:M20/M25/M40 family metallo-hydrolase [Actinomycetota bacterium]
MICYDDDVIRSEAIALLGDLLRIDTSNPPGNETPAAELLQRYLKGAGIESELVARDPRRANLVARIRGTGDGPTLTLLGHTDVVPAEEPNWTHPPFEGHLDDAGYMWGRGATDMKNETATRAVTMALLARGGFKPRGDLWFVAQADEEDGCDEVGLKWLRDERPEIGSDFSIDEGGGIRQELTDGRVMVPINIGEKATLPVLLTAVGEAGHASIPGAADNAVLRLATLLERVGRYRPKRRLLPETRRLLETLIGSLGDDLDRDLERAAALDPDTRHDLLALFATTIAPTRLRGSSARNVIPGRASAELDCRVLPGTTPDDLVVELREALGDDVAYELEVLEEPTGGTAAPLDTALFAACSSWFAEHEPEATLLPVISTGFTDSHFMRERFGTAAYGIWPVRTTPLDVYHSGFHNVDERIHVDDLVLATQFHLYVVQMLIG